MANESREFFTWEMRGCSKKVEGPEQKMIALRHEFHENPELSLKEFERLGAHENIERLMDQNKNAFLFYLSSIIFTSSKNTESEVYAWSVECYWISPPLLKEMLWNFQITISLVIKMEKS